MFRINNNFKILIKYKQFLDLLDNILKNVPRKDIIKTKLAMIDFLLDRLLTKNYVSEKALYKVSSNLVEINKMTSGWLNAS